MQGPVGVPNKTRLAKYRVPNTRWSNTGSSRGAEDQAGHGQWPYVQHQGSCAASAAQVCSEVTMPGQTEWRAGQVMRGRCGMPSRDPPSQAPTLRSAVWALG